MNPRPRSLSMHLPYRLARTSLLLAMTALPVAGTTAGLSLISAPAYAAEDSGDEQGLIVAKKSTLAGDVKLPSGAFRYIGEKEIAQFADGLKTIAEKNKFTTSKVEVLVWPEGRPAKRALPGAIKEAGLVYAAEPSVKIDGGQATAFFAANKGKKNGLLGLMMEQGDTLLVAWTLAVPASGSSSDSPAPGDDSAEDEPSAPTAKPAGKVTQPSPSKPAAGAAVFELDAATRTLNVMKNELPKLPTFPAVTQKPGFVRGYVYDSHGKPLKGAVIGARSTSAGGFYSGASGKTDEKGFYEIEVPWGAASYYCAGYAIDYGEGRAALGLYPADGEADSFTTAKGSVENWVMLPYGIGDRDGIQENPQYLNNYFGGGIVLDANISDTRFPGSTDLPANSEVEITLTPDGPMIDGSPGRTFVIRKKYADYFSQVYVNNIPIGTYKISTKMADGTVLKMKETGPTGGQMFGLTPKEATGEAALQLRPSAARPESPTAGHGNWNQVCINLYQP